MKKYGLIIIKIIDAKDNKQFITRLFDLVVMSWIDPLRLPKSEITTEELVSSVTTSTFIIGSSNTVLADFNNYFK